MMVRTMQCLFLAAVAGACFRATVPPPSPAFNREVDQPCNPANADFAGATRTIQVADAEISVPVQYTPSYNNMNDLTFSRPATELHVWKGARYVFPPMSPTTAVQCQFARGDTVFLVRSVMETGRRFRVDVSVTPEINGQYFYMQLVTGVGERMKDMRAIIEQMRFPVPPRATDSR